MGERAGWSQRLNPGKQSSYWQDQSSACHSGLKDQLLWASVNYDV